MRLFHKKRKIRVIFLAQFMQGCDKFSDVVDIMRNDQSFDVKVIAFPQDIKNFPKNDEYAFWKKRFGDNAINSVTNDNQWVDLKSLKPDYIFFQRPYDNYLPEQYSRTSLMKVARICYIPYGFTLCASNNIALSRDVLQTIDIHFADNKIQQKYAQRIFDTMPQGKHKYSVDLGYPLLDRINLYTKQRTSAFSELTNNLKVIWTPRWTADKNVISGTSFFEYKNKIVGYFKKHPNDQLTFRPHPLAFENFINKGLMSKEEIDDYLSNFSKYNMIYDKSDEYLSTFRDSNVLVTDFSSIIVEYLFFNKPIILCKTSRDIYNQIMQEMSKSFYIADSWTDVKKYLDMLRGGVDPLATERQKLVDKYSKMYDGQVAKNIAEYIKKDYKEKNQ